MNLFIRLLRVGHWLPVDRLMQHARADSQRVCERWDVPRGQDVKPDLRDVRGRYMLTRDGFRISGLLLDSDVQQGSDSPAVPLLLAVLPVLAAILPFVTAAMGMFGVLLIALAIAASTLLVASSVGFLGAVVALAVGVLLPKIGGIAAVAGFAGSLMPATLVAPVLVFGTVGGFISRNPLWHFASIVVAVLAALTGVDMLLARMSPALAGSVWWVAACAVPLGFAFVRQMTRSLVLANQGNRATIASVAPLAVAHIDARAAQAKRANSDSTPFIRLGTARGIFTSKQDPYAPDEGLPFGLTVADLATHLAVFGSTGSGKTTGILKPLAADYLGWSTAASRRLAEGSVERLVPAGGLVILDGKGSLAGEFRGMKDYLHVAPGEVDLGLLEGLEPTDVVLAFQTVNQPKTENSGGGKFFTTAAGEMLRHLAVFLRALVDVEIAEFGRDGNRSWHWTLHDLQSLGMRAQRGNAATATKLEALIAAVEAHHPEGGGLGVLSDAIEYLETTIPGMDSETRANIWTTLLGWITPAMSHPSLLPWARVEFGVSLDRVFRGGAIGVNTPRFTYGVGGTLVQALVKQRMFVHIRRRASYDWQAAGETPVLFLVDEAQEIVGAEDREMLPVARSLGALCVYATQNVENYIVRLGGQHEANGFLDCFQSFASFQSSPATAQWIQHRLGQTASLVPLAGSGHVAYEQNARLASESPLNDPTHEGVRFFRMLARQGAGGTSALHRSQGLARHGSAEGLSLSELALTTGGTTTAQFKLQPLLLDSEYDAYTAEKFCAIAQVQRGGVRRRDVIRANPMFQLPRELVGQQTDHPRQE